MYQTIQSPGSAAKKVSTKKPAQPRLSTAGPVKGPNNIRPSDATADSSAYCVALNDRLHSAMAKATKAAVPMPLAKFSKPMVNINIG